jgi:transcriptional regulator with XRE-family HTH domain
MNKTQVEKSSADKLAAMLAELETSVSYHVESVKLEITEQIYLTMQEQDISKAELARRLEKSRAYVTKILQGTANFTIESLVKIGLALGCQLAFKLQPKQQEQHLEDYAAVLVSSSKAADVKQKYIRLVYSQPLATEDLSDEPFATAA